jgi:predicted acyltransferase
MAKTTTDRVLSLDIFRGLTMALMIMVNNQSGQAFEALRHKSWDGCTPTDLVFPSFLFIVGVSMWFSYRKTDHQLTGRTTLRLLKRGALIFLVGILLQMFPFWDFNNGGWRSIETMRIMGVLQRIGLAFFVGGVVALWLKTYRRIFTAVGVILVGYWLGVELLGDSTQEGFIGCKVDKFLLGEKHLYRPAQSFDPEGIFSTIPAIATVLLGYATGKFVGESRASGDANSPESRMKVLGTLGIAGGLSVLAGLALNTICPINKPIWSSSYVLYAAGIAMLVWMILLWFYDYRGKRFGSTFGAVFGTNTLFSYVLAGVLGRIWGLPFFRFTVGEDRFTIYSWWAAQLREIMAPQLASLLASMTLVALIWCIVYPLYRKKIFIRL